MNLFISNFKKIKKILPAAISPILFFMLVFLIHKALWFLVVDDTKCYTRITFHELYNSEDNIDILFLGSSHCYRSFNTAITDKLFAANTFAAGSSSQCYDGSYAFLVEAGKNNNLQRIYIDIYYDLAYIVYKERTDMSSTQEISDFMKPSYDRFRYLINATNSEYWINNFFPESRVKSDMLDFWYIISLIQEKRSDSYRNYDYIGNPETDNIYYAGKGYIECTYEIVNGNFSQNGHFDSAAVTFSEDNARSLENIIIYCQEHNIELVFISTPMPDFRLADVGDYDSYISYVRDYLSEFNLPYYDFNLCKEEYFSYDSTLFTDSHHLNKTGTELFSTIFSDFFNGRIAEEDLFYSSYEEKMASIDDHFYGLIYNVGYTENTIIYTFEPVQNREFPYYASIFKQISGSDEKIEIQILDALDAVILPADEAGQLLIYIYSDEQGENMTNEIIIDY